MSDKNVSFSVSPSLFIGLGTNGWQMIDDLRRLFIEEFGIAGLPCFRYLALETNTERVEDNSFVLHTPLNSFERVKPIYITIPDISVVRNRIDARMKDEFVPGLAEWLDPNLLNRGNKSYTAGAGHQRQAGRLCLWENWVRGGNVGHELRRAVDQLRSHELQSEADTLLRKEYFGKKKPNMVLPQENLVNTSPKVYILGTLCGGTCSGTFLDIAYFISEILGVKNRSNLRKIKHPEVIGLFTAPDTLRMHEGSHRPHVANCWAALRELDFYFQGESVYRAKLPDGHTIESRDEPFDSVYLVGMANQGGTGFIGDDYRSLAQMCAMNLFTEVVAGMAGKKDEIRINFRAGDAGYLGRNQIGNVRAFSSFGLAAVWYPRYRITKAINRLLGVEMCDGWLSSSTLNPNIVGNDADAFWKTLMESARGSLVGTVQGAHCPLNIEREIESAFEAEGATFMNLDEQRLSSYMTSFPEGATFSDKFKNPDGEFYLKIENAEPLVSKEVRSKVRTFLNEYLADHTLAEAKTLVDILTKRTNDLVKAISADLPVLSQTIDTSLAPEVFSDKWSLLLGMRTRAILEYKQALWGELKSRVINHLGAVRENLLSKVLAGLKQELTNLSGRLTQMETRVRVLREASFCEAQEQIAFKHAPNVIPISKQDPATIKDDVELGTREVLKTTDRVGLRRLLLQLPGGAAIERFEAFQAQALLPQIDVAFGPLAHSVISDFDMGSHAITHLRNKVQNLVLGSQPYIETTAAFQPITTTQSPNFVFCHDLDSGTKLNELAKTDMTGTGFTPSVSPLDHFIFFYQELPGLAISDLRFSTYAAETLQARETAHDRIATSFLDRNGEAMFDVKSVLERGNVQRWISAAKYLVPEAFKQKAGGIYIEFKFDGQLADLLLVDQPDSVADFLKKRGIAIVVDRLQNELRCLGKSEVIERMNKRAEAAVNSEDLKQIRDFHEQLLQETFK